MDLEVNGGEALRCKRRVRPRAGTAAEADTAIGKVTIRKRNERCAMNPLRQIRSGVWLWSGVAGVLLFAAPLAAQQPKLSRTLKAGSGPVARVGFSPDSKLLASWGGGQKPEGPGELKLWDVATGKSTATLQGHKDMVWSVAFSPDGKTLAAGGGLFGNGKPTSEIRLWDVVTGKSTVTLQGITGMVWSVAFSPDGKTLAAAVGATRNERAGPNEAPPGEIRLWDVATGKNTATFEGYRVLMFGSVAFSPDGKLLASGGGPVKQKNGSSVTGEIKLWEVATGKNIATLEGHPGRGCFSNMFAIACAVAFSPDGKTLASAGQNTVELWEVATGKNTATFQWPEGPLVWCVAFSPDGKTLAAGTFPEGSEAGEVRLWDVSTGKNTATFKEGLSVAFSPDGKTLAVGEKGGTIRLWEMPTAKKRDK
jgi:WD40 repeat protein